MMFKLNLLSKVSSLLNMLALVLARAGEYDNSRIILY